MDIEYEITEEKKLDQIAEVLCKSDTILLIGSGISRWSGLSSWKKLLEELCDYCHGLGYDVEEARSEVSAGRFEEAASLVYLQDSADEIAKFFVNHPIFCTAVPHEIHSKILDLGPRSFITPNYDSLLEKAFYQKYGNNLDVILNNNIKDLARIQKSDSKDFIYKYHGDINSPNSIILSIHQYDEIVHENQVVKDTIQGLFKSRNVVMMGVGLDDRDMQTFLTDLNTHYNGNIGGLFAIINDIGPEKQKLIKKSRGLSVVSYEKDESRTDSHYLLLDIIDKLAKRIQEIRNSSAAKTEEDVAQVAIEEVLSEEEIVARLGNREDRELREAVLSIFHWRGPLHKLQLKECLVQLDFNVTEEILWPIIELLIARRTLRSVGSILFPEDAELIEALGLKRIYDAPKLIEGTGNA